MTVPAALPWMAKEKYCQSAKMALRFGQRVGITVHRWFGTFKR
jgi:hypothetical protein